MGLVGNANYMEMADFALGFAGIDLGGDDGRNLGLWPWEQGVPYIQPEAEKLHWELQRGYIDSSSRGYDPWSE